MKLTIEKTLKGRLSQFIVDNVDGVYVTHLPGTSLETVAEEADRINQQAGKNLAVPHCAVRNIKSLSEFSNFIIKCREANLNKILVIGGSEQIGKVFQNDEQLLFYKNLYKMYKALPNLEFECGLYPQTQTLQFMKNKVHDESRFRGGITQLCMNVNLLKSIGEYVGDPVKIGIPSMCSANGLLRYMKICGNKSFKYILNNWKGIFYLKEGKFDVKRFTSLIQHDRYHVYNFGKLEKTVETLLS